MDPFDSSFPHGFVFISVFPVTLLLKVTAHPFIQQYVVLGTRRVPGACRCQTRRWNKSGPFPPAVHTSFRACGGLDGGTKAPARSEVWGGNLGYGDLEVGRSYPDKKGGGPVIDGRTGLLRPTGRTQQLQEGQTGWAQSWSGGRAWLSTWQI